MMQVENQTVMNQKNEGSTSYYASKYPHFDLNLNTEDQDSLFDQVDQSLLPVIIPEEVVEEVEAEEVFEKFHADESVRVGDVLVFVMTYLVKLVIVLIQMLVIVIVGMWTVVTDIFSNSSGHNHRPVSRQKNNSVNIINNIHVSSQSGVNIKNNIYVNN